MIDTIPGLLRDAARRWGDRPALRSMHEPAVNFGPLDACADRFAKALLADDMLAGERVGIWAPNSWEWVAAAVGAQRVGGTLVPLNPSLRAAEVTDILRRARVTRLVATGDPRGGHYPAMLRLDDLPELRRIVVLRQAGPAVHACERNWESFLASGDRIAEATLREREAGVTPDTLADILFTSGTTGRPKGAVFTHRRSILSAGGARNFAAIRDTDCLCPLGPFAHLAGYKAGWLTGLLTGATVCWLESRDRDSILEAIATLHISVMPAPPITWRGILDHPRRAECDLSSLRFVATGSTVIPPDVVQRLVSELKVQQVATGYGMTETGGNTNFTRPGDPVEKIVHTCGQAAPDARVRVVAPDGQSLPADAAGEILVQTDRMLLEYLDDPAATRDALTEGWLHTGDVGCLDDGGYLRITDRLKDMYITNGYNVYPAELERLLSAMPGVSQCAVIGVPDARRGEVGHLFLVRAESGPLLTDSEVLEWCRDHIARYKVPAGVTFLDDLPRSSLGKVLKRELKSML